MIFKLKNNNNIFRILQELNEILPISLKKQVIWVYLLIVINSFLDLLGLAALLPVFIVLLSDDILNVHPIISQVYSLFNFSSLDLFIIFIASLLLFIVITKNIVSIVISKRIGIFSFEIHKYLAKKVLDTVLKKGHLYISSHNSNDLLNNIISIPKMFAKGYIFPFLTLLNELTILLVIITTLFFYNFNIVIIIAVVIFPTFIIFYNLIKRKISKIGQEINDLSPQMGRPVFDVIFGHTEAIISGTEKKFVSKFNSKVKRSAELSVTNSVLTYIPPKLIEVVIIMTLMIIVIYGLKFMDSKESLIQLLGVFGIAAYRMIPTINRIMGSIMSMKANVFCLERLKIVKEEQNTVKHEKIEFKESLELKNISFSYMKGEPILNKINLTIRKGDKIGFIGKSGSGKTTLINLILRFLTETEGEITIDGIKITENNKKSWQQKIGYVKQDVYLRDASFAENIAFGLEKEDINVHLLNEVIQKASLTDLVNNLENGVDSRIGERGSQLSGGQRQRIGIARALYFGAEILVFDEATSALDQDTELEITNSIHSLNKSELTVLIIAHRHSSLSPCDKIIELNQGQIENEFSYEELISKVG